MKVALHSILHPGQEAAYEHVHAKIPPEVVQALQAVGISNWSIWRSGRDLFHLIECEDFDAAMARLELLPVNHRWRQQMAPYVDRMVEGGDGSGSFALRKVWTLTGQLRGEADAEGEI